MSQVAKQLTSNSWTNQSQMDLMQWKTEYCDTRENWEHRAWDASRWNNMVHKTANLKVVASALRS